MKTRKKKYGGELVQKQLDDCVKEKQVLTVKLEKETKEKKDLSTMIQELYKQTADLAERQTITEEKLTKVSQKFLENRVITAIYDVIHHEKYQNDPNRIKKNSSKTSSNPAQKPVKEYTGNPVYQNIDEKKLRDMRHEYAHYCLDNITRDKPLYDQYKKYLFEKIKKLQQENLPIIAYINKRLIDVSYNKLDPIFDLNAFISVLSTETASVTITPEIRTEIDIWWNHGLI